MWQQWLNGLLGLWVILLPFLGLTGETAVWTFVVSGMLIAILGFWGALERRPIM